MRPTAWILTIGLLSSLFTGCSTPRMGLAKSEPPKPSGDERVKYGIPWTNKDKDKEAARVAAGEKTSSELPPDLMAKLAEARATGSTSQKSKVTEILQRAAAAESRGELEIAQVSYQEVISIAPDHGEAHHRLGVIADMKKDPETADKHYALAYAANPRDADLLSDMGYSLYLRGSYDRAEQKLKEALEQNSFHRSAQTNLGLVYGKQGKYDAALALFRQSGTESEAQKNIAALFPNGRPGGPGTAAPNMSMAATSSPLPVTGGTAPERTGALPMPSDIDRMMPGQNSDLSALQQHLSRQNSGDPSTSVTPAAAWDSPTDSSRSSSNLAAAFPDNNWPATSTNRPAGNNFGSTSSTSLPPWGQSAGANTPASPAPGSSLSTSSGAAPSSTAWPEVNFAASTAQNPASSGSESSFWQGALAGTNAPVRNAPATGFPAPSNGGAASLWPSMSAPDASGNRVDQASHQDWGDSSVTSGTMPGRSQGTPSQWAAQMAMGTGPGTMFPQAMSSQSGTMPPGNNAITPWGSQSTPRTAAAVDPRSASAFAQSPFANAPHQVQHAQWDQPAMAPAGTGTTANPAAGANPSAGIDWQSIAPPSPWNDVSPASGWGAGMSPAIPANNGSASGSAPGGQPAAGGPFSNVTTWPGLDPGAPTNSRSGAGMPIVTPGPSSVPAWPQPSGNGYGNTGNPPSTASSLPTNPASVPNWPYAPSRP